MRKVKKFDVTGAALCVIAAGLVLMVFSRPDISRIWLIIPIVLVVSGFVIQLKAFRRRKRWWDETDRRLKQLEEINQLSRPNRLN